MARGPKIGEVLVQAGLIDEFQLEAGLAQQQRWGGRLGRALVQLGFLQESDFVRVLSKVLNVPVVRLAEKKPSPETLGLVPAELAEKYGCLPLFTKREGGANTLYLGIEDPSDLKTLDELSFRIGMKVKPVLVGPSELREAIARTYHHRASGEPEESGSIAETLFEPGDTAPVLEPPVVPNPSAVRRPTPAAPAHEPELVLDDPAPLSSGSARARAAGESGESAGGGKPRDVPTRAILRALTQLLIEKGVIRREELMERLKSLEQAGDGGGKP
jgi:type IV pilus assembly protein PilB